MDSLFEIELDLAAKGSRESARTPYRGALIIEDDYDGEFRYDGSPLEALRTAAAAVFYVGTFSKCMLSALRLGFAVAPEWAMRTLIAAKNCLDWHCSTPVRMGVAGFIAAVFLIAPAIGRAENVAITFDDLPLNGSLAPNTTRTGVVKDVLAILKKYRIPQVYGFVNAVELEGSRDGAEALKLWVAGGQRVGNHTYTHRDLNDETTESYLRDLWQNEPVLELVGEKDTWRWFRYPFMHEGDTLEKRRAVRAQLRERGYRIAQVTLAYDDYLWNSAYVRCASKGDGNAIAGLRSSYLDTASQYLDVERQKINMVFGREISQVLLLHLGAFSSSILPDLFNLLHQKGFKFVTLEEAERDSAYDSDPDTASRNGGSLEDQWMDARALQYPRAPNRPYEQMEALCR
jgi:peptidoglycan-N-acetylglucosamine deacetylase